jgi:large subunit ribosomal protein L44
MVSLPTKFRPAKDLTSPYLQAAEDALHRLYLTKTPPEMVRLPTMTFPEVDGNIFTKGEEIEFRPGQLGTSEVQLGSAGRSRIIT